MTLEKPAEILPNPAGRIAVQCPRSDVKSTFKINFRASWKMAALEINPGEKH
jgi:hypothetical protein